jgi:Domain of unknown function (DUF4172)
VTYYRQRIEAFPDIITSVYEVIMAPAKLRSRRWIWQHPNWPIFTWDDAALSAPLSRARRAQGELAGVARLLDSKLDLSAQIEVLTLEGMMTSAIEGEKFNPDSLRSSLARRLGLPTAGLPPPSRAVEGLVEVLLDATQRSDQPLTLKRLNAWQAALFPTGRSGLSTIRVGTLRGDAPMQIVSGPIGRERVHYEAPPRARLQRDMRAFLKWFNDPPAGLIPQSRLSLADRPLHGKSLIKTRRVFFEAGDPVRGKATARAVASSTAAVNRAPRPARSLL